MSTSPEPIVFLILGYLSTCLFFVVSLILFRNGHLDIVKYLVDGGHYQSNSKGEDERTALHIAAV